ncbi:hypothetical protein EAO77_31935 [Streptomyces sp. t39]|nr:hypothetical protein EAO77_31935 [Streptomyces sp. t39]
MNTRHEAGTAAAHHVVVLGAGYAGMAAQGRRGRHRPRHGNAMSADLPAGVKYNGSGEWSRVSR